MAGGTGPAGRGRGGKFKKYTRGGGHHFSRDLRPLDADGNEVGMWSSGAKKNDSESEEESEEEESSEDEAGPSGSKGPKVELTREELKAQKKARKEAAIARAKAAAVQVGDLPPSDSEEESEDDDAPMPANPNHSKAARKQTQKPVAPKAAAESDDEATAGVKKLSIADSAPGNRKEREAAAAAAAKERYQKLHEAGKTDQAKADLARLKLIREKREQEAARKQAEKEEREAQEKLKREQFEAKEAKRREAALGPQKKAKSSKN
ncbi:casein kinase substrate phosphoprotein PP28-domain-containing protein [Copromyces sp. CBS 386.78]|nr:casein kinase substrate phosphoprotein PP28-domain-containing protein [Copromyces sp. CBS 386.78]